MRVDVIGTAMRRPTRMTDTQRALAGLPVVRDRVHQIRDFARAPVQFESAGFVKNCDTRGVIAAIF